MSSEEDNEELDPRIRDKLEELNHATNTINQLEKQFEDANAHFRTTLNETSSHLKQLSQKLGVKNIEESRPYYDLKDRALALQSSCQKAAVKYERSCQLVAHAKETITIAEQRFKNEPHTDFDAAWQEMLNHATDKLLTAEGQKRQSELEHCYCMKRYLDEERRLTIIERQLRRAINKSRPYFEEAASVQRQLNDLKSGIEHLSKVIFEAKKSYSKTLKDLEAISEEIHEKRAQIMVKLLQREPGVGAELDTDYDSIDERNSSPTITNDTSEESVPQLKIDSHLCQLQVFPRLSPQMPSSLSPPICPSSSSPSSPSSSLSISNDDADSVTFAFNSKCDINDDNIVEDNGQLPYDNCNNDDVVKHCNETPFVDIDLKN